jgi:hypothetical protein
MTTVARSGQAAPAVAGRLERGVGRSRYAEERQELTARRMV